jgi:hypothetical protein
MRSSALNRWEMASKEQGTFKEEEARRIRAV